MIDATKSGNESPLNGARFPASRRIGPKAFYLEPWLILASVIFWMAVLPFAGLVWSATTLAKRVHAQVDGAARGQATRSNSTRLAPLYR